MTRTELLALAQRLERYGDNDCDAAAALLRKRAALQPVAWQERTQLSRTCWSEWYERVSFPAKAPKQIVSGGVTYQFRPVYTLSEVLTDE